jgi:peptidyl-dipeptidase A
VETNKREKGRNFVTNTNFETQVQQFLDETESRFADVIADFGRASWDMQTNSTPETVKKWQELSIKLGRLLADDATFNQVRELYARRDELTDAKIRRQLEVVHAQFLNRWQDPATLEELTALEGEVQRTYNTFRGTYKGQALPDNELKKILEESRDSDEVREAYLASKEIGAAVSEKVLQLAELRNAAARKIGFRDHYQKALAGQELDETELYNLLGELDRATAEPFRRAKAKLDAERAARFGLASVDELRPWHYGDPFFQRPPVGDDSPLDGIFADGKEIENLTTKTYDGLGMDIRDILARSDLYEREGKSQHAFCTHIDRRTDDVRVVCNLQPTPRWMETNLHEFGHAVYNKYIGQTLPFWLRSYAHISTTEAIAMLMGRLATDKNWLAQIKGLDLAKLGDKLATLSERQSFSLLVFMRWGLVMTHFERDMYANPRRTDLNDLWWDYVERFQLLKRPENRHAPDWAAKIHLATVPAYYQNYLLGELTASQLWAHIERDVPGNTLVLNPAAGDYLRKLFGLGMTHNWSETIREVTGEPLTPRYFVEQATV